MILLDADFVISTGLVEDISRNYPKIMTDLYNKVALVLPAFGTRDEGKKGARLAYKVIKGEHTVPEQSSHMPVEG